MLKMFVLTGLLLASGIGAQLIMVDKSDGTSAFDIAAASVPEFIEAQNAALRAAGQSVAIARIDVTLNASALSAGANAQTTFYAKNHTLRLSTRWVQGDPRRQGRSAISYANWRPGMFTLNRDGEFFDVESGLDAAAATWNRVLCSNARLLETAVPANVIPSRYLRFSGYTNVPSLADIRNVGWLPGVIFDRVFGPNGKNFVGVTIYSAFVDPATGQFTDIDGDQRPDQADAEIWFQEGGFFDIRWTLLPSRDFSQDGVFDVETIVLHELGHALDLDHVGALFVSADGFFREAPIAVMNAFATYSKRVPYGTDAAALCSNFGAWKLP
jgi:hypothetical protein